MKANTTLQLNAFTGFVIYKKSCEDLERDGWITKTTAFFIEVNNKNYEELDDYHKEYDKFVVHNDFRNDIIKRVVEKYRDSKKILILTRRVLHAQILGELIPNSFVITGGTESEERKINFADFKDSKDKVLIGSMKIFSAGVNIPDLDIIINAAGHKSSIDSIQSVGRIKRNYPGKKDSYFVDFDDSTPYLMVASKERKEILERFGNRVVEVNNVDKLEIY